MLLSIYLRHCHYFRRENNDNIAGVITYRLGLWRKY